MNNSKHVRWDYPDDGVLSRNWFARLWKFLNLAIQPEYNEVSISDFLVNSLGEYPIVPTKDGKLATVKMAKSVLAVTNKAGNVIQKQVAKILESLACPFLDESITEKASSSVVLPLVADPHRVSDVLHVLDYMHSTEAFDMSKLDEKEINILLEFIQEDWKNPQSLNIAKKLPLYKGVDGKYHSLTSYHSYIRVPPSLPHGGVEELQSMHEMQTLFLPPTSHSYIDQLYKALGVMIVCGISQFYIRYVLPRFASFSQECQIQFLTNIREYLRRTAGTSKRDLTDKLQHTRCITDQTGNLRLASSYFNPHNALFKVMFKPDSHVFPSSQFHDKDWMQFLLLIGLKDSCDQQQFIQFAKEVEESARRSCEYDKNILAQSKALVMFLLKDEHVMGWSFQEISTITFIFPEEVEEELSSLCSQYRVDGKLEFVSYRNSIPWNSRNLVWTSAQLLPEWAYPCDGHLSSSLGIPVNPPLECVVDHMKIISKYAQELLKSDSSLPEKLIDVFQKIYKFLQGLMSCSKDTLSSQCTEKCHEIGDCLALVACILLSKERHVLKGEELSFEDQEKLKPHLYTVPRREYAIYEHLLKRLGVTEKISASQMANVLNSIKTSCIKDTMSREEDEKARYATGILFKSLSNDDENAVETRLSNCEVLYLPSMTKKLVESNNLVCKVQPRLRDSVAKLGYEVLCPLEKCELKRALENDYLEALPKRLRPKPLISLVREELDPFCKKHMTCSYCKEMNCPFIDRLILLLRSSQFKHGVLRFLKHQKNSTTLDDEDKERVARLSSTKVSRLSMIDAGNMVRHDFYILYLIKVLMKRKIRYCDYGFIGKNFLDDSITSITVFSYQS